MLRARPKIAERRPRISGVILFALMTAVVLARPLAVISQDYLIDKGSPDCDNQGPGSASRPWCNLYGLNGKHFRPGSTVVIKAGDYIGNEDPTGGFEYHKYISIYAGGSSDQPFTIKAWPGDEGNVRIYAASTRSGYSFLFWGGHVRVVGLTFVGHVDLPEGGRLYAPNMIRFAVSDGPVQDIHFDGVRIVAFQGADDVGIGCRWTERPPVGECDVTRTAEGWARGIDITEVSGLTFENGEISCTDEVGKVGLEEMRAKGLYLGGDGVKSGRGCSDMTFRNNEFYACGHDDLMFTDCKNVLIEGNYFKNELHRSVGFTGGGNHIVRYNTFAAWEERRVELRNGGGNALQLRSSNSQIHHNIFYGGGEPDHQGAITLAGLGDFVVRNNDIFNNVFLGRNSMSFHLNDKFDPPFNIRDSRIHNNIFIGESTENGVFNWEVAARDAYLGGETFGNEIRNNIFYSPRGDPEVLSTSKFGSPRTMSEVEFNSLAVASGNRFADPGLAHLDFDEPDFHIETSCVAIKAGLPIDVTHDFGHDLISAEGKNPSIGAYIATFDGLAQPKLFHPVDRAAGETPFTTFYWEPIDGADGYHLQVSEDSLFQNLSFDQDRLPLNQYSVQVPLPYSSRLFWRVRVAAPVGTTYPESASCRPWSAPRRLIIAVGTAAEETSDLPTEYHLARNYPNPFGQVTSISFSLPVPSMVNLTVFDVLGRVISVLIDEPMQAGQHTAEWDAQSLVGGTYFYRLQAGEFTQTSAMLVSG